MRAPRDITQLLAGETVLTFNTSPTQYFGSATGHAAARKTVVDKPWS